MGTRARGRPIRGIGSALASRCARNALLLPQPLPPLPSLPAAVGARGAADAPTASAAASAAGAASGATHAFTARNQPRAAATASPDDLNTSPPGATTATAVPTAAPPAARHHGLAREPKPLDAAHDAPRQCESPSQRVARLRTVEDVLEWASELGFHGPIGARHADADVWLGEPSDGERELASLLLADAEASVLSANETASWVSRMGTAFHWLALFHSALPNMVKLHPLGGPDHRENALKNENFWARLAAFMRRHGSIKRGQMGAPVGSGQVQAVISALRAFRAIGARYSLVTPECNEWLPRIKRSMRKEDGPALERKLQLGIRARHFEQLDSVGWDRSSTEGIYDHALAHTLKIVIGRGGEGGLVEGKGQSAFDPRKAPTVADFRSWFDAHPRVNDGLPWLRVWWYPIKDQHGTHAKVPIPVSKRGHTATGADPACPYDAIHAWWAIRSRQVPESRWDQEAFFAHPTTGKICDTGYVRILARRMGRLLGISEAALGAKSFRIAGATDLYDAHGEYAQRLLKERGRWHTDIAYIYARISESAHLTAARAMANASGVDMEHGAGWVQPGR